MQIANHLPEKISIHTFRQLLPAIFAIFRFHIKLYWHFHWVTPKQYYTLFHTLNNTDIFRELLVNNTTYFSRVYIKQYWHFQRVPSKLNYSKNSFQSTYHTIMTLSESYYGQYWLIQNYSYQTVFTLSQNYYQTIVNTFSRVWMDTWTDRKFSIKSEKR